MNRNLLIIALLILISGCDPKTQYQRIIKNNTSKDIWVKVERDEFQPEYKEEGFLILKNSEMPILTSTFTGDPSQFIKCDDADGRRIIGEGIVDHDTLVITKKLNLESNWTYIELDTYKRGGGECECVFTLDENDIE